MMDCRSIEIFYNVYKNSIRTINGLEHKLLNEAYTQGRWYDLLREKSRTIRELYAQNEELFDITIGELLRHPEQLNMELAEMFLTHIDFFWSEGYRDYGVVVPVLDVLIPFYEEHGTRARLFDCFFFQGVAVMEQQRFEEAIGWFERGIGMYASLSDCEENYRQYRIMCAYYHRLVAYRWHSEFDQNKLLEYYQSAFEIWTKKVPAGFLTEKKIAGIASVLRLLVTYTVNDLLEQKVNILPRLRAVVEEEYMCEEQQGEPLDYAVFVVYCKLRWQSGEIGRGAYVEQLSERYRADGQRFASGYGYGTWDFTALFDDELPDEEFDKGNLFFSQPSYAYVNYLLPEILKYRTEPSMREKIVWEVYRYYSEMDYISGDGMIDILIERNLKVVLRFCSSVQMVNLLVQNVLVHRQIYSAIHAIMVSRFASVITDYLIEKHPQELVGVFGTSSVNEVMMRRVELMEYAQTAGMIHDIGKLICTDIINLQTRKIQDAEFDMIKNHPERGARMVHESPLLYKYEDVVCGHHKTYDGRGGYPEAFCNTQSQYRLFIDIITICDSVDAATDILGRNYATAKTFQQVLLELKEQSGTRYNGRLVELIAADEEFVRKIERLTREERAMAQFEVYKKFVRPDLNFVPEDEKYVRPCTLEDIAAVCAFSGESEEVQREICRSADAGYLLLDGHGTIFGAVFANVIDVENIDICQIVVDRQHRRNGCGSMLLDHLVNIAYSKGYARIYMREVLEGHYDKFGWRNGFASCDREGCLVRVL